MAHLSVPNVPDELHNKFKARAVMSGVSIKAYTIALLAAYIASDENTTIVKAVEHHIAKLKE